MSNRRKLPRANSIDAQVARIAVTLVQMSDERFDSLLLGVVNERSKYGSPRAKEMIAAWEADSANTKSND